MNLVGRLRRFRALIWARWIRTQGRFARWIVRWRVALGIAIGAALVTATVALFDELQRIVEPHLLTGDRMAGLRDVLVAFGASLVGATVITFSFVMFALQVNVERMPHGLFQRLSSDRRLLGAFFATFLLATGVLASSLLVDVVSAAVVLFGASWATLLVLVLFIYAYRRALVLINPSQQLAIVVSAACGDLRRWGRRARRAAPLLEESGDGRHLEEGGSNHDLPRLRFFGLNRDWTARAEQAVRYAMTLAHDYTERGDHEVAAAALNAVVVINASYVQAKGRTFFAANPWFDNPLSTDGFINETLEQLRQTARIAVRRADERQVEQTFEAMAALSAVYLRIDYAGEQHPKTHANLAAGYLADAAKLVIPHDMPDVLMEGARVLGAVAKQFLAADQALAVMNVVEALRDLATVGIVMPPHRPATQTAVAELAELTVLLLQMRGHDAEYVGKRIREMMAALAKAFMQVDDAPLQNVVSQNLAPYYSIASEQSLPAKMVALVNALIEAKEEDADAERTLGNVERWSDHLYVSYKELLLTAIEKKSSFMFDVVHGIERFAALLIALSNAPACDEHTRQRLRRHGDWLVHVLSWIPDDTAAIQFSETYGVTETLFSVAVEAEDRQCEDVAERFRKLLLWWAMMASRHDTGWAIPERALSALAALAVRTEGEEAEEALITQINEVLAKPDAPSGDRRARVARELLEIGGRYQNPAYARSRIDHAVASVDRRRLVELLERIAALLEGASDGTVSLGPDPVDYDA